MTFDEQTTTSRPTFAGLTAGLFLLVSLAGTACDGGDSSGDRDTNPTADTAVAADVADSGVPDDVSDAESTGDSSTASDAGGELGADFPISGVFTGEAEVTLPGGSSPHTIRATFTEQAGTFRGLMKVHGNDGPLFEYVVTGELDDRRQSIDLKLSARRCVAENSPVSCESGAIPDEPVVGTVGEWTGDGFEFTAPNPIEGAPGNFMAALESLTFEPAQGFGPGSGRQAPTGGFRPAGNDAGDTGDTEPEPLPEGKSLWSGRATTAQFVDEGSGDPIDCLFELDTTDGSVSLSMFACSELSLVVEDPAKGQAHVVDNGFETAGDNTAFGILVERGEATYKFTGRRQADLISGVILRKDRALNLDPDPVDPGEVADNIVVGAFYFEQQ